MEQKKLLLEMGILSESWLNALEHQLW